MSDVLTPVDGGDLDLQAAEYVIGTLDVRERAAFARRIQADSLARQAVTRWELRCAELDDQIEPLAPPPHVWELIERALRAERLTVIDGGRIAIPERLPNLRASRNRWRAATVLSGGIAAALALFVVGSRVGRIDQSTDTPGDTYVAAINRGGDKPALIVRVDMRTRKVVVRPVAAETPAGKSLELWYIDPGQAPRSMGLIDKAAEILPIPSEGTGSATTFAVSVEPQGGSKTGGPTGPVVYAGQLVKE